MSKPRKKDKIAHFDVAKLKDLLRKMGARPAHFVIPLFLGLAAAGFEAISVGLLIPLANGVIKMDFGFIRELPVFKTLSIKFLSTSSNLSIFFLLVGIVFLTAVIKNVLEYFSSLSIAYQLRKFSDRMRRAIFQRYLSFGKLFFDRTSIGHHEYILTGCTDTIVMNIMGLHEIFSTTFKSMVYVMIMFAISWKLTIIIIIIFPLMNSSLRGIIDKIKSGSVYYTQAHLALSRGIFNALSCIPLVKLYNKEQLERQRFDKSSELVAKWEFSMDKKWRLTKPVTEIGLLIVILLLISFMVFTVMRGQAGRIGSFLVYFYILRRTAEGFRIPSKIKVILASITGPASELLKVFDDKDKFFVPQGNKVFADLKRGIEFNGLSFSYTRGLVVLEEISFFIEKGKMTAVIGPTGVGKTTLINLILRFYDCPPSTVFIDGTDIREFTLESLRDQMALVSQDVLLFNDTLRNNIAYGGNQPVSEENLIDATKKARLYDFVSKLPRGFDTEIGDRGVKLSGGEKQRVSIARALLKDAEILILDEATSSLDTSTERLIQEAIEEAIRGKTTIVIAHRLSTIRNADKIVVIEKGRFVEEGSLTELLEKKGKFYQYWEEQKFY